MVNKVSAQKDVLRLRDTGTRTRETMLALTMYVVTCEFDITGRIFCYEERSVIEGKSKEIERPFGRMTARGIYLHRKVFIARIPI